ncbi:hypothetical protein BDK51DRAFT_29499 [Blyttiomyces helicus]|uniref:Uncharacterized protein n=1 Tax=Blyttiomyces helicus TaxID=388810 RepID=A0A4P9VWX1_9FUNG|nr:hypothetical protein BDK51DRAFT_29499 [Blyttiomyces helicus]|eukprot:RKO83193.1 hypothetical protein BDK51DRAFT_29499 [Blyttiomyces helicus]
MPEKLRRALEMPNLLSRSRRAPRRGGRGGFAEYNECGSGRGGLSEIGGRRGLDDQMLTLTARASREVRQREEIRPVGDAFEGVGVSRKNCLVSVTEVVEDVAEIGPVTVDEDGTVVLVRLRNPLAAEQGGEEGVARGAESIDGRLETLP